ncbi:hypothetical protein DRV85_11145 [Rhodosalinus halophilus]|uniref:DUF1643 domain-containing protein n=1 Tax=Rhodosalinus halophilus TaxID=2259333 RepID=A0A365U7U1_9RHOB|nr:DUF1643 domain-containing protein [Rhodosalinus halophilus]RBI84825.1 hypothetical protein DRV85_11145 [Rhodosalinus halophilus]
MVTRRHMKGDAASVAVYSPCLRYRYLLDRVWDARGRRVHFLMLNPSTATEVQNDPTVERCERRARALGFGAFTVTNIFAWRETDPKAMRRAEDPVGPENDRAIRDAAGAADKTVAAWGTHGAFLGRGPAVARMLAQAGVTVHHLGLTRDGHPRHPLYVAYAKAPEPWLEMTADG